MSSPPNEPPASRPLNIPRIDARHGNLETALTALRKKLSPQGNVVSEASKHRTMEVFGEHLTPTQVVERIVNDVRIQGLPALLDYTLKLTSSEVTADTLRVSTEEMQAAHAKAEPAFLATVRAVRDNILEFQKAILHKEVTVVRPGVELRQRYLPLQRVGCCVPGGAAAYPSTVLMTAVPAMAAGVKEIVLSAPPTDFGANNADVLATCVELGITEVYRMGGAQGVAALAYGVEGLTKVDKIVGPGNIFVTLAKKLVFGDVDIDSLAGPSEVVVIADDTTNPHFAAADLLSQAEHSPGAAVLITWSENALNAIQGELEMQIPSLSRSELTIQSLNEFGCLILVQDAAEACRVTNLLAPEHLHIAAEHPEVLLKSIKNVGAAFLGPHTPVALGDYAAGPSHVLPTSGTARWASGLSANSFMRSSSVLQFDAKALQLIAPHVQRLADKEGLTAHRTSVDIRTAQDK